MGALAFAGALSGAGQQMGQGLLNLQHGFIQSGLLNEREELERKRLQLTFEHAERLEGRREAHAGALQKSSQEFQAEQTDKTIEANRAMNRERIGAELTGKGMDLNERREQHQTEKTLKEKELDLKGRDVASQENLRASQGEYYKALKQYTLTGRGASGSGSPGKIDLETKKAVAEFYSKRIAPLEKQAADSLTSPEDRANLNKKIDALSKKALAQFGLIDEADDVTPDTIGELDPNRDLHPQLFGPGSTENQLKTKATPQAAEKPNLPIVGRNPVEPTIEDVRKYQRDYEEATKTTGKVSAVVDDFRRRFGRSPTEEEFRAANRPER